MFKRIIIAAMLFIIPIASYAATSAYADDRKGAWPSEKELGKMSSRPLPPGELGELIKTGRDIVKNTPNHPLTKAYVKNKLNCGSCHLRLGTDIEALPFFGVASAYPAWSEREKSVITLADRIANCFMRSLNGVRPPVDSTAVTALTAYITWLSEGFPLAMNYAAPNGPYRLRLIDVSKAVPDLNNGKRLYTGKCASCHGPEGRGVLAIQMPGASDGGAPPVWGDGSYNKGAGMLDLAKAASFLRASMPYADAKLTDKEAVDIAAYMNSKDRPGFELGSHMETEKNTPDAVTRPDTTHVDIPVKLAAANVVFNMDHRAFDGDKPVGMKYMLLTAKKLRKDATTFRIIGIFHGDAAYMTLNDKAYNLFRHVDTGNPFKNLLKEMLDEGVEVEECVVSMRAHGWSNDDLLPGVKVNEGAVGRLVQLVQQGFVQIEP
jgi:thiosulfate dehydrogenase